MTSTFAGLGARRVKTRFPVLAAITRQMLPLLVLALFSLLADGRTARAQENGIFSGRVVDVAQLAVPGASVYVYNSSNTRRPADYISPPSDGGGAFQLSLPAGHYWAVARQRQGLRPGQEQYGPLLPGDRHSGAPLEIDITTGATVQEEFVVADLKETSQLAVKVDTSFFRIAGKLLRKTGEPVADAYAYARLEPSRQGIPEYVSAWSDSSGSYTLFLPAGAYWLGLARSFPPGPESVPRQKVIVDKADDNINIVIE